MNIKEVFTKEKAVQLILCAFIGGMVLSILELYTMMQNKEKVDAFFFGGMFIAGLLGIIGYIISSPDNAKAALFSGVSAPQILGGITKAASITAKTTVSFLFPIITNVYAESIKSTDSVSVIVISKQSDSVSLRSGMREYALSDINRIKVEKKDTVYVFGKEMEKKIIILDSGINDKIKKKDRKDIIMKISVSERKEEYRSSRILRGIFAQQQSNSENVTKKIEVKIE